MVHNHGILSVNQVCMLLDCLHNGTIDFVLKLGFISLLQYCLNFLPAEILKVIINLMNEVWSCHYWGQFEHSVSHAVEVREIQTIWTLSRWDLEDTTKRAYTCTDTSFQTKMYSFSEEYLLCRAWDTSALIIRHSIFMCLIRLVSSWPGSEDWQSMTWDLWSRSLDPRKKHDKGNQSQSSTHSVQCV